MPALLHNRPDKPPLAVFESASILLYLARTFDKGFRFHFEDDDLEQEMLDWCFWQMSNLGPAQGNVRQPRSFKGCSHTPHPDTLRETVQLLGSLPGRGAAQRLCEGAVRGAALAPSLCFLLTSPAAADILAAHVSYLIETKRCYQVLNDRLATRQYIVGDKLSLADMCSQPWSVPALTLLPLSTLI